jgi:hypothetical protein
MELPLVMWTLMWVVPIVAVYLIIKTLRSGRGRVDLALAEIRDRLERIEQALRHHVVEVEAPATAEIVT